MYAAASQPNPIQSNPDQTENLGIASIHPNHPYFSLSIRYKNVKVVDLIIRTFQKPMSNRTLHGWMLIERSIVTMRDRESGAMVF